MSRRDELKEAVIVAWASSLEQPDSTAICQMVDKLNIPAGQCRIMVVKLLQCSVGMSDKDKAALAGVDPRYWRKCHSDPRFRLACAEASKRYIGHKLPEVTSAFVRDAQFGDGTNQRVMMQQCGVLDKPEKGGDTNVNVIVTIEEREKLKREEEKGLARFIDRCGYDLVVSNN